MVIARCSHPVVFPADELAADSREERTVWTLFFLVSPEKDPGQHLRVLAQTGDLREIEIAAALRMRPARKRRERKCN